MNLNSNNNYPKNYIHFPQPNFFNSSPPENEEIKLKKLQKDLEDKLKGNMLPLSNEEKNSNSNSINNNRNFDQKNFDEKKNKIISSPVNMNDEELMRRIFGNNSYNQSPLDGIITTGNANNFVNNNKMSNLNEDNLYLNALSCLKGDKMVAPKNKFIAVKELNLNDINQRKIVDTQNLIDLKNQMNIEQKMQLYNKNKERNDR